MKTDAEGDKSGAVDPGTAQVLEDLVYHAEVLGYYSLDCEK